MKVQSVSTLGFELNYNVPSSVEEYDTLAKAVGACLESGINNVVYRSVLAKFRSKFSEALENNTGIKRKTELVLDKDGNPKKDEDGNEVERYVETEKDHFQRVCAELVKAGSFASIEAAAASFHADAQSLIDTIVFDPSEPEKSSSGPKKVAKAYIAYATDMEKAGNLPILANKLREKLGSTWKIEDTVDSVARAIAEDQRRIRESQKLGDLYTV